MSSYSKHLPNRRVTPQTQPARADQVPNNAGGFSFKLDDWKRLERFLILGSEGGTYYVGEKDLTKGNHDTAVRCIKADGQRTVNLVNEISHSGRALKNEPAILVLALATAHGDDSTKSAAFAAVPSVCRTGTHLFSFCEYANSLRGWGRGLRKAVGNWYSSKDVYDLAYQLVKYQSRNGWAHRDVLRLAHPTPANKAQESALRWAVGGMDSLASRDVTRRHGDTKAVETYGAVKRYLPTLIKAFEQAKAATSAKEIVELIVEHNLPREAIPTQFLNNLEVWDALLQNMPMTAMIRNLGKMSSIGLLKPLSQASKLVVSKLKDQEYLQKSRIHPMQLLIALKVYGSGHGIKGDLTWSTVPQVMDALDKAFYLSFRNVKPIGKPVLFGLDVSGSMSSMMSGTCISCCEATAAMSLVLASTEEDYHIMGFAHSFVELGIHKGMSLTEATRKTQMHNFGSTDCSLPMVWANKNKVGVGGFVVITDNETYAGAIHPHQALKQYRDSINPTAKSVVMGMTSTDVTIADPNDAGSMDVAGFDASCPGVISDFIRE